MTYLVSFYSVYLVLAFAIGVVTGFLTWAAESRGRWFGGWFGFSILLFVAGVVVALFKLLPGRAGLYLELALLFYAAYIVGCWLGSVLRGLFAPVRQAERNAANREDASSSTGAAARSRSDAPAAATPEATVSTGAIGAASADPSHVETGRQDRSPARGAGGSSSGVDTVQPADAVPAGNHAGAGIEQAASTGATKSVAVSSAESLATHSATAASGVSATSAAGAAQAARAAFTGEGNAAATAGASAGAGTDNLPGTRPEALTAPQGGKADDLKRIRGIGKVNETKLHALGIFHFVQIAGWSPENVEWAGEYLAFPGRIEREDWVGQAKVLAAGQDTDFSRRVDAGEVPSSDDGEPEPLPGLQPAGLAAARNGTPDDLKRIRGIGRQNEDRLNALGIFHFDQIAGWNAANCEWAGAFMSFPGRIEREDWVGQAKVLAQGGETDFSRRVARGEVETSRDEEDDADK
jgi:predicted flap endonuclease-1-like 5' DNA nuclease